MPLDKNQNGGRIVHVKEEIMVDTKEIKEKNTNTDEQPQDVLFIYNKDGDAVYFDRNGDFTFGKREDFKCSCVIDYENEKQPCDFETMDIDDNFLD